VKPILEISFWVFSFILLTVSCKKECGTSEIAPPEYMIIATTHGECDDCFGGYKWNKEGIFPDEVRFIGLDSMKFKSVSIEQSRIQKAYPQFLDLIKLTRDCPPKTYGNPNAADGPGFYLEIKENGIIKKWHIDQDPSSTGSIIPKEAQALADFYDKMKF
jgi:hypothetical protein